MQWPQPRALSFLCPISIHTSGTGICLVETRERHGAKGTGWLGQGSGLPTCLVTATVGCSKTLPGLRVSSALKPLLTPSDRRPQGPLHRPWLLQLQTVLPASLYVSVSPAPVSGLRPSLGGDQVSCLLFSSADLGPGTEGFFE